MRGLTFNCCHSPLIYLNTSRGSPGQSFLIVISSNDFDYQLIFDKTTLPLLVIGLILSLIVPGRDIIKSILGMLTGGLSLYIVGLIGTLISRKEAMGLGDVKLGPQTSIQGLNGPLQVAHKNAISGDLLFLSLE